MSGLDPDAGARFVEGLLRLYPVGWRARYGDEFAAVLIASLADGARRWRLALDVLAGAVDAHVHPSPHLGGTPMPDRMRHAASTAFCAAVAFAIAGSAFAKMTEDHPFTAAAHAHHLVGWSFSVIFVGALLAGLSVLAGGLPILGSIVRQALAGRRDLRPLLLVPPAAVGAWIASILIIARALDHRGGSSGHLAFLAIIALGVLASAASTAALIAAARRADLASRVTRVQWLPMTVLSLAMVAVTVAGLVWGLALRDQAPALFHSDNGLTSTALPVTWGAVIAVMAVASGVAVTATRRALDLRRVERGPASG